MDLEADTYMASKAFEMVRIAQGAHELARQSLFTFSADLAPFRLLPLCRLLLLRIGQRAGEGPVWIRRGKALRVLHVKGIRVLSYQAVSTRVVRIPLRRSVAFQ
jgi:hypothetical protein